MCYCVLVLGDCSSVLCCCIALCRLVTAVGLWAVGLWDALFFRIRMQKFCIVTGHESNVIDSESKRQYDTQCTPLQFEKKCKDGRKGPLKWVMGAQ